MFGKKKNPDKQVKATTTPKELFTEAELNLQGQLSRSLTPVLAKMSRLELIGYAAAQKVKLDAYGELIHTAFSGLKALSDVLEVVQSRQLKSNEAINKLANGESITPLPELNINDLKGIFTAN